MMFAFSSLHICLKKKYENVHYRELDKYLNIFCVIINYRGITKGTILLSFHFPIKYVYLFSSIYYIIVCS